MIKVSGPNLPINIIMIRITLPAVDKSGVIPVLNPTVPKAEMVSKRTLELEKFSV